MKKVIENQLNLFETIFTTVVKHTTKREKQKDLKEETQLSFIQISTSKEKEEIKSEIKEEIKCKIKEDIKNEVIEPTEIIPVQKGEDYRIKEDDLIFNGPKMKYQCNIEAIKTLLKVEAENRPATKEEQSLLVKYVGWGGLSEVFDVTKESWEKEFYELKSLLGEKEYRKARESVLTAFFTPKAIIDFMYKFLKNLILLKGMF